MVSVQYIRGRCPKQSKHHKTYTFIPWLTDGSYNHQTFGSLLAFTTTRQDSITLELNLMKRSVPNGRYKHVLTKRGDATHTGLSFICIGMLGRRFGMEWSRLVSVGAQKRKRKVKTVGQRLSRHTEHQGKDAPFLITSATCFSFLLPN